MGMERYRIEIGHNDKVQPGNIVGAIANEAGIDSQHIGRIVIYDEFSTVDLPEGMPTDLYKELKKTWVAGKKMDISLLTERKVLHKPNRDEAPAAGMKKAKVSAAKKADGKKPRKPRTFKKPTA
jgi:ATP-dependent RNA helicase DeaD